MPGRLQALLAQRGIRMTSPRRAILGVIETANKHLDASQILRKAQKSDPSVDRSTVYRTLGLLKRHGLIDELDLMHLNGEKHYYEVKTRRDHLHLACFQCGRIQEFASPLFEELKSEISRLNGFQIRVVRLEVGGLCSSCRGSANGRGTRKEAPRTRRTTA